MPRDPSPEEEVISQKKIAQDKKCYVPQSYTARVVYSIGYTNQVRGAERGRGCLCHVVKERAFAVGRRKVRAGCCFAVLTPKSSPYSNLARGHKTGSNILQGKQKTKTERREQRKKKKWIKWHAQLRLLFHTSITSYVLKHENYSSGISYLYL